MQISKYKVQKTGDQCILHLLHKYKVSVRAVSNRKCIRGKRKESHAYQPACEWVVAEGDVAK